VHPRGGTCGHARRVQSGLGAAIITVVYDAPERLELAEELADAFLDGRWRAEDLAERGAGRLDRWPSWLDALAFAAAGIDRSAPSQRRGELVGLIDAFLRVRPAEPPGIDPPLILRRLAPTRRTLAHDWPVARIGSVVALAERLELSDGQLAWLADIRSLERTVAREKLRNYRYRWVARRSGLPRLLEAPKARLKEIQRWLLHEILDQVPLHDAAHGFTRGRSVRTHAARHIGQPAVLRLDLRDFFSSVTAGRVYGIFRTLGYAPSVAHVLTGLCTNTIPTAVWNGLGPAVQPSLIQPRFWLGRALATPHLPQGAPTSPALANLAAFGLDRRLSGLATKSNLHYSRYADDLTFSGGMPRRRRGPLVELVAKITADEGFRLHPDKSTLRTASQRQLVTGVVINAKLNTPRDEYDRLRAILHHHATNRPDGCVPGAPVDMQAHLRGRVAWVSSLNPHRGEKLRRLLDAIDWDAGASGDH
jgi:RNA-directed DNA polymerase